MAEESQKTETRITKGKEFAGVVLSNKMKNTIVVKVTRYVKHPKYQKYVKHDKRYKVHDEGNTKEVGERVVIRGTKPISKGKHFIVV